MDNVVIGILLIGSIIAGGIISLIYKELKGIIVTVVLFFLFCFFYGGGTVDELIRLLETQQVTEETNVTPAKNITAGVTEKSVTTTVASGNEDIVSYALQFVGNPYVWGGDSLTNGCDCSHFVAGVLAGAGYWDGRWVKSDNWAFEGEPVDSLDKALAGDVIVYKGHVAIYDGEGLIVEAKGSEWGITHDRAADCKKIVAIRRFHKLND